MQRALRPLLPRPRRPGRDDLRRDRRSDAADGRCGGYFSLTLSGGEPLLRKDLFAILRRARELTFNVKLKTNAILIEEKEAALIRELGVESVQISIYSHRRRFTTRSPRCPGSLDRSIKRDPLPGVAGPKGDDGQRADAQNRADYPGVQALAQELGAPVHHRPHDHAAYQRRPLHCWRSTFSRARSEREVMRDPNDRGRQRRGVLRAASAADEDVTGRLPCSAGHSACYISPYGDVYPCVQFPLPSGNVRQQHFHRHLEAFAAAGGGPLDPRPGPAGVLEVARTSADARRCPGLAYMEGNMRGPSTADCEKSSPKPVFPVPICC